MPSSPANQKPSIKQQRDARRAEKVAQAKKREAASRRNRRIGIAGAGVGVAAVLALVVTIVVSGATSRPSFTPGDGQPGADGEITGLVDFGTVAATHVDPEPVDYEVAFGMNPPAGGDHWAGWLNCGVYSEPQENERAVHSLEHGAIWVTYDPDALSDDEVAQLRSSLPRTYIVLSPYPGLPSPVVASAWGVQVQLDGPSDERLAQFVTQFWQAPTAPEPNAPCTGGIDGPGLVS